MSETSFDILCNTSRQTGTLRYAHSNREIFILWPYRLRPRQWNEGHEKDPTIDPLLGPLIHWIGEDSSERIWPAYQHRLRNQHKDVFFTQLTNRVPGITWCLNPEMSTPTALIYMISELAGIQSIHEAMYYSQLKPELFWGLAHTLWIYSTVAQVSGGLSDALPLELRLNMLLSMVEVLLAEMVLQDTATRSVL